MDKNELINEFGIEIAIEKLSNKINEMFEEYEKTKDETIKKRILLMIADRDKIYNNDKETIKKYF